MSFVLKEAQQKSNTSKPVQANTKQDITIASNSNKQAEVSPAINIFDLNDYYESGYKTDKQNKDAASAIRRDILKNYGISDNDSDKDEKLKKIYLDILEDSKNEYLRKVYEDNKEEYKDFNEKFEMTVAHMTHDGTNKGDEVHLSEVDFSDIDYDDKPQNGSIETNVTENGTDYIVYDSNNNVVKCISKTTDENGVTTIAEYSDLNKTCKISADKGLILQKSDDEIKFKFGTGEQNTVDFKDNGSYISVELSKGVVKENSTVEKNSDGTYSLNGKQYFTLEEIASDLNKKELYENISLDSLINASTQGEAGNCGFLSAINSLSTNEQGRQAIKNAISFDENGNVKVNFPGAEKEYMITADEFQQYQSFSNGDPDVKALEIAFEKMLKDVQDGVLVLNNDRGYNNTVEQLNKKASNNIPLITGTNPLSVYDLLTGKRSYKGVSDSLDDKAKLDFLNEMESDETVMCVYNIPDDNGNYNVLTSDKLVKRPYKDAFGNDIEIYDTHAYAVKESDTRPDGTRIITIINPHDSSQEIVLDEKTFLKAFNRGGAMSFKLDASKPVYKLA